MCINKIVFIAMVLSTSLVLVSQGPALKEGQPQALSLSTTLLRNTVKRDEPIWIETVRSNISNHTISIWQERRGSFVVEVKNTSNTHMRDKRRFHKNGRLDVSQETLAALSPSELEELTNSLTGNFVEIVLKPGEVRRERIDVAKLYDMTGPGVYNVVVECSDAESATPLRSAPMKVTVTN